MLPSCVVSSIECMEYLTVCAVDLFIIGVVFISALCGIFRGATKEILSLVSWGGSIFLTIIIFPYVKNIARSNISHGLIADFVTACVLFVLFLTLLSVFNYICSNCVKQSMFRGVDRFLGGVFGVIRGIIIIAVADVMVGQWFITDEIPEWMEQSRLRPQIINIANFVVLVLPDSLQDKLVAHMSKINRENLFKFISDDVLNSQPGTLQNKTLVKAEAARNLDTSILTQEDNEIEILSDKGKEQQPFSQEEEARKLATLTPKDNSHLDENDVVSKKTEKEVLDMQRLLDQDLIDNKGDEE